MFFTICIAKKPQNQKNRYISYLHFQFHFLFTSLFWKITSRYFTALFIVISLWKLRLQTHFHENQSPYLIIFQICIWKKVKTHLNFYHDDSKTDLNERNFIKSELRRNVKRNTNIILRKMSTYLYLNEMLGCVRTLPPK